jgi:crotonobetainyl-CoA:carnitine CoA-transferase CaiB-like acyl-CoA transferase
MARTDAAGHAPFHILPCKDGYICAAFVEEAEWRRFVGVMGNPEWADNELFVNFSTRAKYWDALKPLMVEWTKKYTGAARKKQCRWVLSVPPTRY